jgi:hypothetical protein
MQLQLFALYGINRRGELEYSMRFRNKFLFSCIFSLLTLSIASVVQAQAQAEASPDATALAKQSQIPFEPGQCSVAIQIRWLVTR